MNHPGVILFDEPGQHSMNTNGEKALMQILSGEKQLQSIVAASFDDSAALFAEVTEGSKCHLIRLPQKVAGPMDHDGGDVVPSPVDLRDRQACHGDAAQG